MAASASGGGKAAVELLFLPPAAEKIVVHVDLNADVGALQAAVHKAWPRGVPKYDAAASVRLLSRGAMLRRGQPLSSYAGFAPGTQIKVHVARPVPPASAASASAATKASKGGAAASAAPAEQGEQGEADPKGCCRIL